MDRRERVADALQKLEPFRPYGRGEAEHAADAALAAADADTVRVPREPTEGMIEAGADSFWMEGVTSAGEVADRVYRAMLAAADRECEKE